MVQTAAAMEFYNGYWVNSYLPAADVLWMVVILIVALLALWQARTFVSKF
ncbi:MAG: hypothetical protein A4E24_00753 [Methanomethylovorans sp. PtaU1.Bin093]|nr:hypothetical protein [Methanomethylovorans sp. PtaU1.Bin093]OPY21122.1 MAG: hypothetical protein A4E24_00753 [Methanomethylovorans sp. PtaU1.Bin093]